MYNLLFLYQDKPTPLAIRVAKKGIEEKPKSSIFMINLNLETKLLLILGNLPLLKGKDHKIYVTVG